ncbi:MAG TPA: hypothetical protein VKT27_16480 [Candidatus Binataceae bacterium]|nr:hypothetical protein [Candidatus Binataceae bacterium]
MNIRYAAGLVLAGWFLITPPLQANGRYDLAASLSKWKIEGGAGSREQCLQTRALLSARAAKENNPSDIEAVKSARCVPMNDPQLEGN